MFLSLISTVNKPAQYKEKGQIYIFKRNKKTYCVFFNILLI